MKTEVPLPRSFGEGHKHMAADEVTIVKGKPFGFVKFATASPELTRVHLSSLMETAPPTPTRITCKMLRRRKLLSPSLVFRFPLMCNDASCLHNAICTNWSHR
eukprot:6275216-Amphidinium_carterae.1